MPGRFRQPNEHFAITLKIPDLTDVKNFYSDKDLTRIDYLKRSLLIIGSFATIHILSTIKYSRRYTPTSTLQWMFEIVFGGALLVWTLSKEIVTGIKLDFDDKKIIVHYMTIFSDDKETEVPFEFLTFDFIKEPTRHQTQKWGLKIFNKKKNVVSIETNEDGFSQETLDNLVVELKKITKMENIYSQ
jgi:hypothetical protein